MVGGGLCVLVPARKEEVGRYVDCRVFPVHVHLRERIFIGRMTSDRKLKASREGSPQRIYET